MQFRDTMAGKRSRSLVRRHRSRPTQEGHVAPQPTFLLWSRRGNGT